MQNITPQAKEIYDLLSKEKKLTAAQIGEKLGIFPNAVYRAVDVMINFGFIKKIGRYPTFYIANNPNSPIDLYTNFLKAELSESLSTKLKNKHTLLDLSFIQARSQLIEMTDADIARAKNSANFIVSGLEAPAETILAYKNAVDRGVKIRILVQNLNEVNSEMLKNWKKIGVNIKYFPKIEARIFVFDGQIVYFTSYNSDRPQEAVGIRFHHPSFATMMNELFEMRWRMGKNID